MDILHQFVINAPAQKVFDAFCTPKGLNDWWPLESSGAPRMGSEYRLYFGPEYDWRATVIHVVDGKEITWEMDQAMDDWIGTKVGVRLREEKGSTIVDFFHIGWESANDHYRISNYCWGTLLNGLKNLVEEGIVVPFKDRN